MSLASPTSLMIRKLQQGIRELERASEGQLVSLSPVHITPVTGPMNGPPTIDDSAWHRLEPGELWGTIHGTVWLMAILPVLAEPTTLRLLWDTHESDDLLLKVEATVFLDGHAIGALDYRHLSLLLPERAHDGKVHTLTIQAYTQHPLIFQGIVLQHRKVTLWRLARLMHTAFEAALSLSEHDSVRHALLERLNAVYSRLDLREGWRSERLAQSATMAFAYLQAHLTEQLVTGERPHILISGHAHLDVGWQWPYWRTRQKIAHTISNVLDLMDRYPNYHYSQSQPQVLQWLKEDMPEVYRRVKQRVTEGRFELVGAMWVEADCNLTSGESLIRQIMHGTRFTQQEFGITPHHIWLPDVFGYSAALPQIMRGCDLPVFMTTKISWNQFNRMPCDTFRWRGIDGSEVLAHFVTAPDLSARSNHYTYNGPLRPEDMVGTWQNYRQQPINRDLLYLCGWGDGGGGPTESQLEDSLTMADLPNFPVVRWGNVDEYFGALYEHVWDNPRLPNWVGELYLEYHRGTYTSQAHMKQLNRQMELYYREVEFLNSWASLYGMPFRQQDLNEGWRRILLNQFHDVLPGSSIHEVYEDAERIYAEARAIGEQIRNEALTVLTERLDTQKIVVLNSLPWERTEPIQTADVVGLKGVSVQQSTDWDGQSVTLINGIAVPPCGIVAYSHNAIEEMSDALCTVKRTASGSIVLHNDFYTLTLNAQGEMQSLYDERAKREVFVPGQTGNQLVAYEDRPLNFDAWDIDLFYEEKAYPIQEISSLRILEEGPIRVTVEIERRYMASRITQRISLWRTLPRIDIATEIDWHEHQTLLKAVFPLDVNSTKATYEIQFGSVERPTHRNTSWDMARFEVCAHRWVDVSESGYGVSLLNDSKYGHDCHDNILRLTLLKSGIKPDPQADQGLHRFTYSLLPHQGDWREAQIVRRAYELNVPLTVLPSLHESETEHASKDDNVLTIATHSFVYTDCEHVVVETIKPAEDGNGLIVRLYEAHNQRGHGTLTFAAPILAVYECNLLEQNTIEMPHQEYSVAFQVRPFEIKTFRVCLETL